MRGLGRAAVVLLLATGTARAAGDEAQATLEGAAGAIDRTLREADAAVAEAAADLGRTGLSGAAAHERLAALCEELTYAVVCSATNAEGVLVTVTPSAFSGSEGKDVSGQGHFRALAEGRRPVLSEAYTSVEGFETVTLLHPVYDEDGTFLGAANLLLRPASLVVHAIATVIGTTGLEVFVMQPDGYQLYDPDPEEIGRNLLTDPLYQPYPDLLAVGERMAEEPTGTGEYEFLGRGFGTPVTKRVRWTTVGLYGTEWRVAVTSSGPPEIRYAMPALPVSAEIGLSALIALADGHVRAIADDFSLLADSEGVRSGDWARIEPLLETAGETNLPGVYWYAEPDGSYWTLEAGRTDANLSDRPYFQRALRGETVVGDLVVSKSTGASVGVVAVPVKGPDGAVEGVIGASVYLDRLSEQLEEEMGLGEDTVFYAFGADERLALHSDTEKLFLRAGELGPVVEKAFDDIQARKEGTISYTLEDRPRTVVFRRSEVTGWWYAFGVIGELPKEEAGS